MQLRMTIPDLSGSGMGTCKDQHISKPHRIKTACTMTI